MHQWRKAVTMCRAAGFVGTVEAALFLHTVLARGESGISLADAREFC